MKEACDVNRLVESYQLRWPLLLSGTYRCTSLNTIMQIASCLQRKSVTDNSSFTSADFILQFSASAGGCHQTINYISYTNHRGVEPVRQRKPAKLMLRQKYISRPQCV